MKRSIAKLRHKITGKCPRCKGSGKTFKAGLHAYSWRPCEVCK